MAIHIKPQNKGKLHRDLGVPQGQKLSTAQLEKAKQWAGPEVKKRLVFAENARKWNH